MDGVIAFFADVGFWHWLILGVVLIILEMLAPGVVFLWLGLAALATGIADLVIPANLGWQVQVLIFAGLSVVSVTGGRLWIRSHPTATDHPTLNRRGSQYIGRVFSLDAPIANGVGKLKVDDTTWKIVGSDLPAGTRVTVTGVEGTMLKVEKAD